MEADTLEVRKRLNNDDKSEGTHQGTCVSKKLFEHVYRGKQEMYSY